MIRYDVMEYVTEKNEQGEWEIKDSIKVDNITSTNSSLPEVREALILHGYAMSDCIMDYRGEDICVYLKHHNIPLGELRRK